MNLKQRIIYFWDYHKWKVIIPLAIVIFAILTIRGYLEEIKPTDLNIKVINCNDDASLEEYVKDYSNRLLADKTIELGISYEGYFIHPEVVDEYTGSNSSVASSMQKYQSCVIAGDMDVTIATDWVFGEYGKNNVYMDLSKELPADLYEKIKDDLVYATLESGEKIPVAVYVDESEVLKTAFGENRPAIGIYVRTEKKENAIAFLRYVIAEK